MVHNLVSGLVGLLHDSSKSTSDLKIEYNHQLVDTFTGGIIEGSDYSALSGIKGAGSESAREKAQFKGHRKVVVVGAGVNGIQQATILLNDKRCTLAEIRIFESLEGYGGVWEKNKYPGCACDVPAMIYTTSYFINRKYFNFFATRAQIASYYNAMASHYNLPSCTQFKSFVESCEFDQEAYVWHVFVRNALNNQTEHWTCDVLIHCVGSLDRPKFGTTPGREKFKGISWHTAHWRDDVDLRGKRVAIIGCGPSAAQVIPEIVNKTKHLTVYMRTSPVCVPRNDFAYSKLHNFAMNWVPGYAWLFRWRMMSRMIFYGKPMATNDSDWNLKMTKQALDFVDREIKDPELRAKVKPYSVWYCKRPLRLDHFYSSLAKPNCTVLRSDLVKFTEKGVVSNDNPKTSKQETEREFDIIIFGTGFNVANYLDHISIKGLNGIDLQEKWKNHPEAIYGLATSEFPNMFMNFGPNSTSVFLPPQEGWELQSRFVSRMVKEINNSARRGEKLIVSPERNFEKRYNEINQFGQQNFVWQHSSCVTYYKNDQGWNVFTTCFSLLDFWWMLRKIRWNQWVRVEKPFYTLLAGAASRRKEV